MTATDESSKTDLNPFEIKVRVHSYSKSGSLGGQGIVGNVEQAGTSATSLQGKTVLVPSCQPCGECTPCRKGVVSFCEATVSSASQDTSIVVAQARFSIPLEESTTSDAGDPRAALGGLIGTVYGMMCSGGFKIGTQCVVLAGSSAFQKTCVALSNALGVKTVCVELPLTDESFPDALEFDNSPKLVLAERSHLKEVHSMAQAVPHGSTMVLQHDDSTHEIDFNPWLAQGGSIVSHHQAHPELLPELLSLCDKGFLDLNELVSLGSGNATEGPHEAPRGCVEAFVA